MILSAWRELALDCAGGRWGAAEEARVRALSDGDRARFWALGAVGGAPDPRLAADRLAAALAAAADPCAAYDAACAAAVTAFPAHRARAPLLRAGQAAAAALEARGGLAPEEARGVSEELRRFGAAFWAN